MTQPLDLDLEAVRESVEPARESLSRFVASHFSKADREHARFSIPADRNRDDDLRMEAFIAQVPILIAEVERLRALTQTPHRHVDGSPWYPLSIREAAEPLLAHDPDNTQKLLDFIDAGYAVQKRDQIRRDKLRAVVDAAREVFEAGNEKDSARMFAGMDTMERALSALDQNGGV